MGPINFHKHAKKFAILLGANPNVRVQHTFLLQMTHIQQRVQRAILQHIMQEILLRVPQTRQTLNFIQAVQHQAHGGGRRRRVLHAVLGERAGGTVRGAVTVERVPLGTAHRGQHGALRKKKQHKHNRRTR